ncbi:TrkH family potassium uptake protein [Oceanibaculum indicum]|uniref:TrkH family potassium uptake protein n=1 Tax=Oceanibaculum indicum TaxID=526216 RepID=UPI000EAFD72B|nr:TrkH family potassium uptake protein [Oceanibaculum indicum]
MSPALNLRPILFVLGWLLTVLGAAMLIPVIVDLADGNRDWTSFLASAVITGFVGVSLVLTTRGMPLVLRRQQAFLLTTLAWVTSAFFSALPFMLSDYRLDLADALFETVSGLTTTGSTVMTGLDEAPPGLLLWRSLLQWMGGIGIIGMSMVIFPFLRIGGMQLFKTESSDTSSEKILPSVGRLGIAIGLVYLGLTVLCLLAYWAAGMSGFDAVNHAMTTLSTGGYSTHDSSFGYFEEVSIHWIAVIFMAAGALPFALYIGAIMGKPLLLLRDRQVRAFLLFLVLVCLSIALWLTATQDIPFDEALTLASFNVTSVVTTTGFASDDYSLWGGYVVVFMFLLMTVGGCTGSTTGGIKMFRLDIAVKLFGSYVRSLILPHSVNVPFYRGTPITDDLARAVLLYIFMFAASCVALSVALTLFGLDALTASTAAIQAIGNVGPGLGPVVGPAGNFATIPDGAKWLLSFGMLLGRLEFFTVLVLFSRRFWVA